MLIQSSDPTILWETAIGRDKNSIINIGMRIKGRGERDVWNIWLHSKEW